MPRKARKTTTRKPKRRGSSLRRDTIPRAFLGKEVQRQINKFGLSRETAARLVDDAASQMSRVMTGHFADFSADRLAKFLTRLGSDVTIVVRHAAKLGKRGKVRVKTI